MQFTDAKGSFDTTYQTYCLGQTKLQKDRRIADVIITGKVRLEDSLCSWRFTDRRPIDGRTLSCCLGWTPEYLWASAAS